MTAIPISIRVSRQRWLQLTLGIVCMAMIANLQYGWTLFVNPIDAKYHWGRAAIQVAFSIFVLTETWLVPVEDGLSTGTDRRRWFCSAALWWAPRG